MYTMTDQKGLQALQLLLDVSWLRLFIFQTKKSQECYMNSNTAKYLHNLRHLRLTRNRTQNQGKSGSLENLLASIFFAKQNELIINEYSTR